MRTSTIKGKKAKVVPVLNWLSTMPWKHMGEWRYSSSIPDLGARQRWVVNFTPRPFCLRGNSPRYPLDKTLGGPQSLSGRCGEEKNLVLAEIRTPGRPARSPSLYRRGYPDSWTSNVGSRKFKHGLIHIFGSYLLTYLLMELRPSWEDANCTAT
jgi:hypothetical protein